MSDENYSMLESFFGAKRKSPKRKSPKRKSPKRKSTKHKRGKSVGVIVIGGRDRKVYKGVNGGLFVKRKSGKVYVDKKRVKKTGKSPKRKARKSPKRKARKSPKRKARKSPKRKARRSKYGMQHNLFGSGSFLGGPASLQQMMGPSNLSGEMSGNLSNSYAPSSKPER